MFIAATSLIVIEQRKDHRLGSERILTFVWLFFALGSLVGEAFGNLLIETSYACFLLKALTCAAVSGAAFWTHKSDLQEWKVSTNEQKDQFRKALSERVVRRFIVFLAILYGSVPNLTAMLRAYFQTSLGFEQSALHRLHQFQSLALVLGLGTFYALFKEMPMFVNLLAGQIVKMIACILLTLMSLDNTFGLSPIDFLAIFGTLELTFEHAFLFITFKAQWLKIVPERVEATLVGLYVTIQVFFGWVVARLLTLALSKATGVGSESYDQIWKMFAAQMGCCLIPMLAVSLLPSFRDVVKAQNQIKVEIQTNVQSRDRVEDSTLGIGEMLQQYNKERGVDQERATITYVDGQRKAQGWQDFWRPTEISEVDLSRNTQLSLTQNSSQR
jgi:hypothetical protein